MLPSLPAGSYTQGYRLRHILLSCDWTPLLTRLVPSCFATARAHLAPLSNSLCDGYHYACETPMDPEL